MNNLLICWESDVANTIKLNEIVHVGVDNGMPIPYRVTKISSHAINDIILNEVGLMYVPPG
jgi:hypothetical protein